MASREEMFRMQQMPQKRGPVMAAPMQSAPMQFTPMSTGINMRPEEAKPLPTWEQAKQNWGIGQQPAATTAPQVLPGAAPAAPGGWQSVGGASAGAPAMPMGGGTEGGGGLKGFLGA